jgi:ABC-2 type transport system permease protein
MRPYVAVASARFRMLLQYRAAAIAGVFTQIVFGFVLIMVYDAFYRSAGGRGPIAFAQIASYVWLGQALLAMLPWNADTEVRSMVRSGAIAYELCRPVDLYTLWYVRALALRTAPTLLRAIPMTIFAMVILPAVGLDDWRLAPPPEPTAGLGFLCTFVLAVALGSAIGTLVNISLMWTVSGDGIVMVATTLVSFCSGMIVPLPLLPDGVRIVFEWLPFAGLVDAPFRIYTGALPLADLPLVLGRQLAWTVVLVVLGRWLLGRGMRRVVVQGG